MQNCNRESEMTDRIPMVWDMETQDPDDFLTLLLLLGHPRVDLKAVTITPGTPAQIGVVKHGMHLMGKDIPVGAYDRNYPKDCVSPWHYRAYGECKPDGEAEYGPELILRICDQSTTMVTGAPLKNLGAAIALGIREGTPLRLGRLYAQGGFAGEGVVPPEKQLPKFKGRTTCPTFNLNGDPRSAFDVLDCSGIEERHFVSKNVCHGVIYDQEIHKRVEPLRIESRSLDLIYHGMEVYLAKNPKGKALHDPLAACCAIDEGIGSWAEVEIYRENGEWGSHLYLGSHTWIITDYNHERFLQVFCAR